MCPISQGQWHCSPKTQQKKKHTNGIERTADEKRMCGIVVRQYHRDHEKKKADSDSENDNEEEHSSSEDSAPSEDDESDFEIEAIVNGPWKKKGHRYGKYEIKWVGYESEENTWEPRNHIPPTTMRAYDAQQNAILVKATLAKTK